MGFSSTNRLNKFFSDCIRNLCRAGERFCMQTEPDKPAERQGASAYRLAIEQPNFSSPVKPISELVTHSDFPKSALGEHVDIGGYTGVIVELVKDSLKVRSAEGVTRSFNSHGLRRIYGPALRPDPINEEPISRADQEQNPEGPSPESNVVTEPDFSKPVRNIAEFVGRQDFPRSTLGEHVEIAGYTGVVVEIVNRSLKVRSPAEITRSYNADVLRKLHEKT
jgi:hypothetical protein